jgi:uronate dehydrogenase
MAHVLVTGSEGAIGVPVCRELLARGHRVRGLDRVAPASSAGGAANGFDAVRVELEDRDGVRTALRGIDTVVHLGAYPDDADFSLLEGPNVRGLFHVLDGARQEGVRRVVLASSIQVLDGWWGPTRAEPASVAIETPTNHYGLTKVWAERAGEMYARCYGMSVIAVRVAFMVRNPIEAQRLVQSQLFDAYLSRADVARFFALSVEAADIDFAVLYAVGKGGERLFDMQPARRLLGFEAEHRWPEGLGFEVPEPSAT